MKLQGLAVIAMIIIVPMAILLDSYASNQIQVINLQTSYDTRLMNATYDAVKAFQLNMSNSSTSDLANSKLRDITASVNTFYNALSNNFNMSDYGKEVLNNYVPALVYTLYDGFYIYSAYENNLPNEAFDEEDFIDGSTDVFDSDSEYQDGEDIYGLKPYIYYSCRYVRGDDDFVITYSLDSYITIQGIINDKPVNDSGYMLSDVTREGVEGNYRYLYNGIEIGTENAANGLTQYVYQQDVITGNVTSLDYDSDGDGTVDSTAEVGSINSYPFKKENGVKYYLDQATSQIFSIINEERYLQSGIAAEEIMTNDLGLEYYKQAYEFTDRVLNEYGLTDLSSTDAVDATGTYFSSYTNQEDNPFYDLTIFNTSNGSIEEDKSNFNIHRTEVIKNVMETALIPAISNYEQVSTSQVSFAMPKLTDYEWEQIANNITVISFMQGMNIGSKIYSGHAIVTNDSTEDFVSEDSIYILDNSTATYYKITDPIFSSASSPTNITGVYNSDFERRMVDAIYEIGQNTPSILDDMKYAQTMYYYPRWDTAAYTSVINPNTGISEEFDLKDYLKDNETLAKTYYTALGRERMGMYRVHNIVK